MFLTKLPRELRDKIFRYLVCFDTKLQHFTGYPISQLEYDHWNGELRAWYPIDGTELSLFLVNKQIYTEAREMFLKKNRFQIRIYTFKNMHHLQSAVWQMQDVVVNVEVNDEQTDDLLWTAEFLLRSSPFDNLALRVVAQESSSKLLDIEAYRHFLSTWEPDRNTLDVLRKVEVRKDVKFDVQLGKYSAEPVNTIYGPWLPCLASQMSQMEQNQHLARFRAISEPITKSMTTTVTGEGPDDKADAK